MRNKLFLSVLLAILSYTQADTKILREINIQDDYSNRQETFSLKNPNTPQEELVIEGVRTESIDPQADKDYSYRLETTYVADKDGYRAKYVLVGEAKFDILLSAPSLKSLTG